MTEPSTQDQISALLERVEEQGVEIAQLRRALLSLGSGLLAGGAPGPQGYMAWHNDQMAPPSVAAPEAGSAELTPPVNGQQSAPSGSTGASASSPPPKSIVPPSIGKPAGT